MNFFANLWKNLSLFLVGIITGIVLAIKMLSPGDEITHIEAKEYTEHEDTHIGKIKLHDQPVPENEPMVETPRQKRRRRRREKKDEPKDGE